MVNGNANGKNLPTNETVTGRCKRSLQLFYTGPEPPTVIRNPRGGGVLTHVFQPIKANAHTANGECKMNNERERYRKGNKWDDNHDHRKYDIHTGEDALTHEALWRTRKNGERDDDGVNMAAVEGSVDTQVVTEFTVHKCEYLHNYIWIIRDLRQGQLRHVKFLSRR